MKPYTFLFFAIIGTTLVVTIISALLLSSGNSRRLTKYQKNLVRHIRTSSDHVLQITENHNDLRPISWSQFNEDQRTNAGATVHLFNEDFANGTLTFEYGAHIVLREDIVFSPNEEHDSRPTQLQRDSGLYSHENGFMLGFFAALIFVGDKTLLDMNRHTISVSEIFRIRQGFYTHVSVSRISYINGEGPVSFGPSLDHATNLYIKNGVFGRTSHHAIHGHGAINVTLTNLSMKDYEVAPVSMNGWKNSMMKNVHMLGTATDVHVNGIFTQARFLLPFMDDVCTRSSDVCAKADRLRKLMAQVERDILERGQVDKNRHPEAWSLFGLDSGIIDGGATYGTIITDMGAAVHAFGSPFVKGEGSDGIIVEDCTFQNQQSHAVEVAGATLRNGKFMTGILGDMVDFGRLFHQVESVSSDAYFSAQFSIGHAIYEHYGVEERHSKFGSFNIPKEVIRWAINTDGLDTEWFERMLTSGLFVVQRDVDRQGHTPKGAFGMRIDSSANIFLLGLRVSDTHSYGECGISYALPGEQALTDPSEYTYDNGGHPLKAAAVGYNGADAHGLLIAGCVNLTADSVEVDGTYSKNGKTTEVLFLSL